MHTLHGTFTGQTVYLIFFSSVFVLVYDIAFERFQLFAILELPKINIEIKIQTSNVAGMCECVHFFAIVEYFVVYHKRKNRNSSFIHFYLAIGPGT